MREKASCMPFDDKATRRCLSWPNKATKDRVFVFSEKTAAQHEDDKAAYSECAKVICNRKTNF